MKINKPGARSKGWNPTRIEVVPHQVKDTEYQRTLEELVEIIYATFLPVQESPDSTVTGSNTKMSENDSSERTKSA